jgi:hypothetical protein
LAVVRWLFSHPLGWLILDLCLLLAFGVALVSLVYVERWNVPPALTQLALTILTIGFFAPFMVLLARWVDSRDAQRTRESVSFLAYRQREWAQWAVQRIHDMAPTQPIPVSRITAPKAESIPAQANKDRQKKGLSEDYLFGFFEANIAELESTGEIPRIPSDEEGT